MNQLEKMQELERRVAAKNRMDEIRNELRLTTDPHLRISLIREYRNLEDTVLKPCAGAPTIV
jgi:hypothetical protein